jgi:hypothetical protein
MKLQDFETEGLIEYKENLERNIEIQERALNKEKATLMAVELELQIRERTEAQCLFERTSP